MERVSIMKHFFKSLLALLLWCIKILPFLVLIFVFMTKSLEDKTLIFITIIYGFFIQKGYENFLDEKIDKLIKKKTN